MHQCPYCSQACYCDFEDTEIEENDEDCEHNCDPQDIAESEQEARELHAMTASLRAVTRREPQPRKLGEPNSWQTIWPVPKRDAEE